MASAPKFPYQRLIHDHDHDHDLDLDLDHDYYRERLNIVKSRSWFRFRRVHIKRRFRLKVPGLRRLISRKKLRVVSAVSVSCAKVIKRLKESQAHFGDIFSGNYLFLQINPSSMKSIKKYSCQPANELNLHGLPPRIG